MRISAILCPLELAKEKYADKDDVGETIILRIARNDYTLF